MDKWDERGQSFGWVTASLVFAYREVLRIIFICSMNAEHGHTFTTIYYIHLSWFELDDTHIHAHSSSVHCSTLDSSDCCLFF